MLSIIIPVYNEINTIEKIIDRVNKVNFISKEVILVDDCSTDGTKSLIKNKLYTKVQKVIYHEYNQGKGAAIRSAQKIINGNIVLIQDADLEYSPEDYEILLKPILDKKFQVVYGSRVLGRNRYKVSDFSSVRRVFFNHLLTILSNILNKQKLTDAHTCYKVFESELFKKIDLKEKRFGFCPEVTTKISKLGYKIKEIPISYKGRSFEEGKKIGLIDGFDAIKCLIKYKFID